MLFNDKTPIIAIATAPGRGCIGVIRLSFEADLADPILAALFPQRSIEPRRVQLLPFLDENNALLDHAVVLYFSAPASYTGESVLEIQAHGGPVLLKLILRAALTKLAFCGLRIAEPGEFTKRAFLNGRMDLPQESRAKLQTKLELHQEDLLLHELLWKNLQKVIVLPHVQLPHLPHRSNRLRLLPE